MKKSLFSLLIASSLCMLNAAPKYEGLIKAEEVRPRQGIGNVLKKIRAGEEVVVAYLGGSITSMNGWRNMTTDWLKETYPNAKFKEIHAAIGGTGSALGVFLHYLLGEGASAGGHVDAAHTFFGVGLDGVHHGLGHHYHACTAAEGIVVGILCLFWL
jgi:hypothetical protein